MDVQVVIHMDTLNEAGFVEDSVGAIKGRAIHTSTEGAGGGHAPDISMWRAKCASFFNQPDPTIHSKYHR